MRLNNLPLLATGKCLHFLAATAFFLAFSPSPSRAAITITIQQVGAAVVVTGSGTAITTGLTPFGTSSLNTIVAPAADALLVGPTGGVSGTDFNGVTGPSNFGSGTITLASSGTGDRFGLDSSGTTLLLAVPSGSVSGSALFGSSTFDNTTLAGLGVTPGTYVYSFGSGATADTLTIQAVTGGAAAPEPGSLALVALAGLPVVGLIRRKRK